MGKKDINEDVDQVEDVEADGSPEETSPELDPVAELAEAREQLAEANDRILRVAADFENTKKRLQREHEITLKYAEEHLLKEILPGVDNLERAMEQAQNTDDIGTLIEGLEMTRLGLIGTLEKFGVTPIVGVGEPFDPNIHEALTMEGSDEVPANHVLREFVRGYMYKDRLLRAAKVVVSNGPAE